MSFCKGCCVRLSLELTKALVGGREVEVGVLLLPAMPGFEKAAFLEHCT